MSPQELIAEYEKVLQARHTLVCAALNRYQQALGVLLSTCALPAPQVVPRSGVTTGQDLSTVAWTQEAVAERPTGKITVILRVEFTVSINGFHCAVRDARDERAPLGYSALQPYWELPEQFLAHALKLANDPALPFSAWRGTIYTY